MSVGACKWAWAAGERGNSSMVASSAASGGGRFAAREDSLPRPSDRLVLLYLAWRAGPTRWARGVRVAEIARAAGIDPRTVPRCIRRLRDAGLVGVMARPGKVNAYRLKMGKRR